MKRNKFNLSHYHLTTGNLGEMLVLGNVEILPGDSVQMETTALVRAEPQLKPIMHPVSMAIKHFFVPNRLVWSDWDEFITGAMDTNPPTHAGAAHTVGQLSDYLGIYRDPSNTFNNLALRSVNMVWNEYFRDKDIQSERDLGDNTVPLVNWAKDYFTTSRPWAQKGDAVTLPVGTKAAVKFDAYNGTGHDDKHAAVSGATGAENWGYADDASGTNYTGLAAGQDATLYADMSDANAIDIRDFREAFALQRFAEARARYGSSYVDYLRYHGINPSDSRLQRPEYLAGGSAPFNFSEVMNTAANGGTDVVGEMYGHGIGAIRSNRFRRFFQEHGHLITVGYLRPRSIYTQAHPKKYSRTEKEDYWTKELEGVGAEEILNKEIYAAHSDPDGTFGFGERYADYRTEPSRVSGEFRESTSNDWHLGRVFASDPALNTSFLECNPSKRIFAEQTKDSLKLLVDHKIVARRQVGRKVIGGIL